MYDCSVYLWWLHFRIIYLYFYTNIVWVEFFLPLQLFTWLGEHSPPPKTPTMCVMLCCRPRCPRTGHLGAVCCCPVDIDVVMLCWAWPFGQLGKYLFMLCLAHQSIIPTPFPRCCPVSTVHCPLFTAQFPLSNVRRPVLSAQRAVSSVKP